jgi:hypothetical protein
VSIILREPFFSKIKALRLVDCVASPKFGIMTATSSAVGLLYILLSASLLVIIVIFKSICGLAKTKY